MAGVPVLTAISARIGTLILGVIVLGLGLNSYYSSSWNKYTANTDIEVYKACPFYGEKDCPDISLEQYYISMIIICFILSLAALAASFRVKTERFKLIDTGFHFISAVLLLIAAICYIGSTVKIDNLGIHPINEDPRSEGTLWVFQSSSGKFTFILALEELDFRKGEKIAAGVLTIFQAISYGVTALLISRQKGSG